MNAITKGVHVNFSTCIFLKNDKKAFVVLKTILLGADQIEEVAVV